MAQIFCLEAPSSTFQAIDGQQTTKTQKYFLSVELKQFVGGNTCPVHNSLTELNDRILGKHLMQASDVK